MIKVLIAEDEPLSLQNLTGHLRRLLGADALIEGAANGREAVDMARRIRPQLVLMDISLPFFNGYHWMPRRSFMRRCRRRISSF